MCKCILHCRQKRSWMFWECQQNIGLLSCLMVLQLQQRGLLPVLLKWQRSLVAETPALGWGTSPVEDNVVEGHCPSVQVSIEPLSSGWTLDSGQCPSTSCSLETNVTYLNFTLCFILFSTKVSNSFSVVLKQNCREFCKGGRENVFSSFWHSCM